MSHEKTHNPYLEEFERVNGGKGRWKNSGVFIDHRAEMVKRYAWAVPDQQALEVISRYGPVLEIGAGTGYWARLLCGMGVDVIAYDLRPPESSINEYNHTKQWFEVSEGGTDKAADHPDRSLFLCWPPYDTPMAASALRSYTGKTVIYVGEGRGGCTADDDFHEELGQKFEEVEWVRIPTWESIHDNLSVWTRKPTET